MKRNIKQLKTFEDFMDFMKSSNLQTIFELRTKYFYIFSRYLNLKIIGQISENNKLNKEDDLFKKYIPKSLEEVQNYIDSSNIFDEYSFKVINYRLYRGFLLSNYKLEDIKFAIRPKDSLIYLNDFQKFIEDNNIKDPCDFSERFKKAYCLATNLDYCEKLNYPNRKRAIMNHEFENVDVSDVQKLQEFVNEHKIISKTDLALNYPRIFDKYQILINQDPVNNSILFSKINIDAISSKERGFFKDFIFKYKIEFISQFYLSELIKNEKPYRFDILVKGYKDKYDNFIPLPLTIIEIHGAQHFYRPSGNFFKESLEEIQQNDKNKKLAIEKYGYNVIYFTYDKSIYKQNGYFEFVYTDINDLLNLFNIPSDNIDPDYQKKFNYYFSIEQCKNRLVEKANKFIEENNIETSFQFQQLYLSLYASVQKIGGLSELKYKLRKNDTRLFNTIDDVNKFLIDNKIRGPKWFKLVDLNLYGKASKRGWLKNIKYYNKYETIEEINLSDIDFINKFVITNKIENLKEVKLFSMELYNKIIELNINSSISYYKNPIYEESSLYKTDEEILKFISDNKISSPIDFIKRNKLIYDKARKRKLKFDYYQTKENINIRAIKSETQINKLLYKYKIKDKTSFRQWNLKLYLKCMRFKWNLKYYEEK